MPCLSRRAPFALTSCLALALGCEVDDKKNASETSIASTGGVPAVSGGSTSSGGAANVGGANAAPGGTASGGSSRSGTGGGVAGGTSAGSGSAGGDEPGGTPAEAPFVFVASKDALRAYEMNATDGALTAAGSIDVVNLNFMRVGKPTSAGEHTRTLFVARGESLSDFTYDRGTQTFTEKRSATTPDVGAFIGFNGDNSAVLVAHYLADALSYFAFDETNGFGGTQVLAPGINVHQARVRGDFAYAPCLGSDHVAQFVLASGSGANPSLTPLTPASAPASGGPRHMDFHPTADVAYLLAETSSEIHPFDIDSGGRLVPRTGGSVFTHSDEGGHASSDIHVHPSGEFLYAVNRTPPEVVPFSIDAAQELQRQAPVALSSTVRAFAMDPQGLYLHLGGADGTLETFAVDRVTGALTAKGTTGNLGEIRNSEMHYLEQAP